MPSVEHEQKLDATRLNSLGTSFLDDPEPGTVEILLLASCAAVRRFVVRKVLPAFLSSKSKKVSALGQSDRTSLY